MKADKSCLFASNRDWIHLKEMYLKNIDGLLIQRGIQRPGLEMNRNQESSGELGERTKPKSTLG